MNELIVANIAMAVSAILPWALLSLINHNKKKGFAGYNTSRGQLSEETRKFSAQFAAKGMLWAGLATIAVQATCYYLVGGETAILITGLAMTIGFIAVVVVTEIQLAARFDEEGKPKPLVPKY